VLTSDGEMINGAYRRDDLSAGALVGLAVSAGPVEGRSRAILHMAKADLEPGDILVTAYTDPQLDAPVRRDQGTGDGGGRPDDPRRGDRAGVRPAVVGVENATRLIRDGQRIRVDGTGASRS
jgi:pyruvate,water dikinase